MLDWNPMENDYKSVEFNQYVTGPGANLNHALQPSQKALQNGNKSNEIPTLIFKKVPNAITKNALHSLCSRHGRVTAVRDSIKNPFYFVEFATMADMEATFRGLEKNDYGFTVMISKISNKNRQQVENKSSEIFVPVPPKNTGVDYESRQYCTSKKNPTRPEIKEDSLFNKGDSFVGSLPLNILMNDAHSLERHGLYEMPKNNKFSYRHGRSYIQLPENTSKFITKKHQESVGTYIDSEDKFVNVHSTRMPTNISKCSQCNYASDMVCERCSQYYCSIECQSDDWPQHRYICGKPENLRLSPPNSGIQQFIEMKKNETSEIAEVSRSSPLDKNTVKCSRNLPAPLKMYKQLKKETSPVVPEASEIPRQLSNHSEKACKKLPAALRTSKERLNSSNNSVLASLKAASHPTQKTSENNKQPCEISLPNSGNLVIITSIIKTNVVFVRSITYDDNVSYFNTVDTLQSLGKGLEPLKTLPKSGEVVVAKFEDQFNRALVLKCNDYSKILINFMDYGNTEEAKMEDLYKAPEAIIFKPRHALPVVLKDVDNSYMTEEIRNFMHAYLNNINVEIRYKPEDFLSDQRVFAVELIDENTQQNLNKMIMKLSKPVEPKNSNETCDRSYLRTKMLPVGSDVQLIVMDNSLMLSGCISCTTKPYAIEIDKFKKDIQDYAESTRKEGYAPRVDELCVAQYAKDGLWYRGVCIETVGDGHPSIHFIDYGNITTVPIESIRRYPRQFTFPLCTFDCEIDGLPEFCDDKLVEKLEELIPNGEIIGCENVAVDKEHNFYSLTLPNVITELQKCGLI